MHHVNVTSTSRRTPANASCRSAAQHKCRGNSDGVNDAAKHSEPVSRSLMNDKAPGNSTSGNAVRRLSDGGNRRHVTEP